MRIEIIGIGVIGAAIANAIILTNKRPLELILTETYLPNYKKAYAEYLDLLPIAIDRNIRLGFTFGEQAGGFGADAYVITSGVRRTAPHQTKEQLAEKDKEVKKWKALAVAHSENWAAVRMRKALRGEEK